MRGYKKKLFLIFPLILCAAVLLSQAVSASTSKEVITGGMPFGIKLYTDGLLVVGFSEVECSSGSATPAEDAGIKVGDILTEINGEKINSAEGFISIIENSSDEFELTVSRGGKTIKAKVTPSLSDADGKYKSGMWLRDSTAGIGTVTYIDPETGEFAGLGHGICENGSGELIPLMRGIVTGVKLSGVKIGTVGEAGELRGYFTETKLGLILKNTSCGVFGIYESLPEECSETNRTALGTRSEVHTGKATILSTVGSEGMSEYDIEITRLPDSTEIANFEIRVTDEALIKKTGGIVQGMSGSPILQDGKLVGAVTHVLINDPCRGYGIFIENMLDAAE